MRVQSVLLLQGLIAVTAQAETLVMDDVVVTATRGGSSALQAPAPLAKVDDKQIKTTKAHQIDEVANRAPGVMMVDLGNEQHSMSVRLPISTNAYYGYLEDGVPIRPVGVFNHNALNEINLPGQDSLEVLRGSAGALYGGNAIGGTFNFLTRVARSNGGEVAMRMSDGGYSRVDGSVEKIWDDAGLRATFYKAQVRDGWQKHGDMDKTAFTLRGDWQLNSEWTSKLTFTDSRLDTDMTGSLNETDYNTRPDFSYNTFTYRKDNAQRLSLNVNGQLNGRDLAATVFYRKNTHEQNASYLLRSCTVSASCPTGTVGAITTNNYHSLGLDARWTEHLELWQSRLTGAVLIDNSPSTYTDQRLFVTRNAAPDLTYTGFTTGPLNRDYDTGILNTGLSTEWQAKPRADWLLVTGIRYDRVRYDFSNHLTPSASTGAPSETRDFEHISPQVGATWTIKPGLAVYGHYANGFMAPEVSTLYSRLEVPSIEPATYDTFDLGLRGKDQRFTWELTAYHMSGRDEIVSFNLAPGNSEPRNAGSTRHYGLEALFNWTLSPEWTWNNTATWSQHHYESYRPSATLDYSGKTIKQAPDLIAGTEIAWAKSGYRIALETRYLSEYWMNDANTKNDPGYTLFNLRTQFEHGAWTLWAQGLNLSNEHYSTSSSSSYSGVGTYNPDTQNTYTPGSPRSFWLGVGYRFGAKP